MELENLHEDNDRRMRNVYACYEWEMSKIQDELEELVMLKEEHNKIEVSRKKIRSMEQKEAK